VRHNYRKTHKPLKAEEILAQRSVIPAVENRKRSKITDGIIGPTSKKQKKNWVSSRELQRLKDFLNSTTYLSSNQIENSKDVTFDLWSEEKFAKEEVVYDYLEQPRAKVAPSTISHPPIAMTASGKAVKAVNKPTPGISYNPTFADWDNLLTQEGEKAVEAEKRRLHIEQREAERAARIAAIASEDAPGARTDDESAWEGFESEFESGEPLKTKRPERKTQVQRNRIKRRKDAERQALHQSKVADKRRQARELEQLDKGKNVEQSGADEVLAMVEEGNFPCEDGDDSVIRRKRLRSVAIPEKNLEVVLPDELQESLRRLKPEGNLLNDRFRSLLVNGKIEPRKEILQPKKKRVTYTEKWTHKDFQILV
jgi:Nop53 (60S ribosomal biogenesis)